ncbi:MAG: MotA/TolQ/ExbB proton channel family protein [Halofilum sp. (in: g-proteobacteria)]|nr:MotA/TolQ/ExbB proton channel family protein [Halofilum sp. (in: g-proteobacteria)]
MHESTHLERFGSLILVIAAVSPLLGLLGTVTGMISTFEVITKFGTGDPKLLSGGISTALVTTELGLAVAIPALLIGNLLSGWADRIKDEMEKAALRMTNLYEEARADARGALHAGLFELIDRVTFYFTQGGWVMPVLAVSCLVIWFCIGYRASVLRRPDRSQRRAD